MAQKMICPVCGMEMNHNADKLIYSDEPTRPELGGSIEEFHSCPGCGSIESRPEVR